MIELVAAILVASLLGSLHCAGMCGPFVAFCVGTEKQSPARHVAVQGAYHGGRLVTYTLLGIVAGVLGAMLDFGGARLGIQRTAMILAGVLMVGFGLITLARVAGVRIRKVGVPRFLQSWFMRGQVFAQSRHPVTRALVIGLFSILLPCGWLYLFVIAAASTGSPWLGGLAMAVFWLGTVPILAALGVGVQTLFGPLRKHLPAAMACLLVAVGVVVVFRGFEVQALASDDATTVPIGSVEEALTRVRSAGATVPPCCQPSEAD